MSAVTNALATSNGGNASSYVTASFTPAAGDYLLVFVAATDTAVDGTIADSQGLSWSKVGSVVSNTTNRVIAFISTTTVAASAMTVTWDCTGDDATGAVVSVLRISGSGGQVRQFKTNSGVAAANPSVTFTLNCLTTSSVIFAQCNQSNPHGMTPPAGYTSRNGGAVNGPILGLNACSKNSGETSNTVTAAAASATNWTTFGVELFDSGVGITHATSGTPTGQGSTLAGSSAHKAKHTISGALAGQGSQVVGSSARYRQHAATGVLPGQSAEVSGSSQHKALHATSGTLSGSDASISGSSARFRSHSASGVLFGLIASISGSASMESGAVTHDTSGSLVGDGSDIDGSSNKYRQHVTSGEISAPGASINGVSLHHLLHTSSGDLVGDGSDVVGSSSRYRQHTTSGVLSGQGSTVSGSAGRTRRHEVTGELIGQGALMSGAASNPADVQLISDTITATYAAPVIAATYAQSTMTATYTEYTIEASI